MAVNILLLYYSRNGATAALARQISRGVAEVEGAVPIMRQVASLHDDITPEGPPLVSTDDLAACDALALGSPTRFGNMAAPLKHFIDSTAPQWFNGALEGKPAAVFTSSSSMHGGQESTLLSMALPLVHHGMVLLGVPYSEAALHHTSRGGGPYGASHVENSEKAKNPSQAITLTADEIAIAKTLGRRLARAALSLKENPID